MVKIGQIGCGYWGPNILRNLSQLDKVDFIKVADISEDRLNYIKKNYPLISTTSDYHEIINDPEIEAVMVVLPVELHYSVAKECLQAGKHTFVEKPLALKSAEGEELVRLAAEKERVLMVGHTFLYNNAVRKAKKYIGQGELGKIYYIYAQRLNLGIVRRDVNVMWNLAPHDISIVLYWLGEMPQAVIAQGITQLQEGIEDVVLLSLEFSQGRLVHIHNSWLDPHKVRKMTVVGSKKMLVYDDTAADSKIQVYDKGIDKKHIDSKLEQYDNFAKFQLIKRAGDILIPKIDFQEPLRLECQHFVDCVVNHKTPLTDGQSGLRVVQILEAAQKSLRQRRPITLN